MDRFMDLWYQPVHPGRLRRFEQAFVASFLYYMSERFRYANEWLTADGFHLTAATKSWFHVTPFPLLQDWMVPIFGGLLFGCGLCVIAGWQRRFCTFILLACAIYAQNVDLPSAFTLNKFYILVMAVLAVQPASKEFVDEESRPVERQSAWALRTLQATLIVSYLGAGICKVAYGDWLVHSDVLWTHVQGVYRTDIAAWMLRVLPKWSWTVQMMAALAFETIGPFLFLFRRTRGFVMIWGLFFHVLIAVTMHQLIYFSLQLVVFYLLFLPVDKLFLKEPDGRMVVA